jgi:hypothetical protein
MKLGIHTAPLMVLAIAALALPACCSSGRASPPEPAGNEGPPPPDTQDSVEARVEALLSGYEMVPSAEDWARAGTPQEVSAALMHIAERPAGKTLMASRALSSLAHFPRPEVASFLEARVGDGALPAGLRGKAAIALAAGFGDAKAGVVAPLFASPDEDLRDNAVRAFKHFLSPAAEAFLEARAAVEPAERLRGVMRAARDHIADTRAARTKASSYPKELDALPPLADPGPVRKQP